MGILTAPVQALVLSESGAKPEIPTPATITPSDSRFDITRHIMTGQLAYNVTDDIWYYRNNGSVKALGGGTLEINDVEVWRSDKIYRAGNTFVSYENDASLDPEFHDPYIYRCIEDAIVGESPESTPSKWERQGTEVSVDNLQAENIIYDNTTSWLTADRVQGAIDDIAGRINWNVVHATSDVNPALPNTYYKMDASAQPLTVYLPDPVEGCSDEFDIELHINTHKITVTTVSGVVDAIGGNTSIVIPNVGGRLKFKCHSVEGYDVIADSREMRRVVNVTSDLDLTTDGFEHKNIYKVNPDPFGSAVLITLPAPSTFDQNKLSNATFSLTGNGTVTVVRQDGGFIGNATQQTIAQTGATITIQEGEGEYVISQDSRPKDTESVLELPTYRLDDASDIPGYSALTTNKQDPRYGTELLLSTPALTDATIGNPQNYASYATDDGYELGDFPASTINFLATTRISNQSGNANNRRGAVVYYELYKRDSVGTETLLLQTAPFYVVSESFSQVLISAESDPASFLPTDRLVWKIWVEKEDNTGGINPIVETKIEGDDGARLIFRLPSSLARHGNLIGLSDASQHPATSIDYDNTASGLTADTVQDAIDELSTGGSGTDENAIHDNVAAEISAVASLGVTDNLKRSDLVILEDASDSYAKKQFNLIDAGLMGRAAANAINANGEVNYPIAGIKSHLTVQDGITNFGVSFNTGPFAKDVTDLYSTYRTVITLDNSGNSSDTVITLTGVDVFLSSSISGGSYDLPAGKIAVIEFFTEHNQAGTLINYGREVLLESSITRKREVATALGATYSLDWEGNNEIVTSGDLTLTSNCTVSYTNTGNAELAVLDLNVTGSAWTLTFPSGTVMQESDTRWTSGTRQLALEVGRYKITIKKTQTVYTVECSDKYV